MMTDEQIKKALLEKRRPKRKEIAHRYYIKNREAIIKKVTGRKMELKQQNLFGGEDSAEYTVGHESSLQYWKRINRYRRRTLTDCNEKTQHCGTCKNGYQISCGNKVIRKCKLMGDSGGPASDVSMLCVCKKFEVK